MPVQTRSSSRGRTAPAPSLNTIKNGVTKSRATPKKATSLKTASGSIKKKSSTTATSRQHKGKPSIGEGSIHKIEEAITGTPGGKPETGSAKVGDVLYYISFIHLRPSKKEKSRVWFLLFFFIRS